MEEKLTQMRSYWLGRQTGSERTALEDLWFESDEDAELLTAVRDDLIEDYLSNDLTTEESSQFKTFFLGELLMSHEVGLAAAIRDAAPARTAAALAPDADDGLLASVLAGLRSLFTGGLAPAAAGAFVVLLAVGGFVGYRVLNENVSQSIAQVDPPQINESPQPTPDLSNTSPIDDPRPQPEVAQGTKDKNTNKPNDPPRGPKSDDFDLSDSVTMSPGEMPAKDVPESVESLTLKLARPMLNPNFKEKYSYRISPLDPSGGRAAGQIGQDLGKLTSDDSFTINVPAKQLRTGRYELTIHGQNLAGKTERLSGLRFRINRKPVK